MTQQNSTTTDATFTSADIDLCSAIALKTRLFPIPSQGRNLVEFTFPATEEVRRAIIQYAGGMQVDARRFAGIRNRLFRAMREATRQGGVK